ncbi:hypothetical protein [Nocardia acidivorans]|uniref:hypothetical protein n=1 Tax=Nocardia acidivorans TaxID=404580 RepID=UPI000AB30E62|nr:hypothetical protein [Nocardia acidivorans]
MNTGVRRALRPALGALPLALAIACAGMAHAIPQPGVTTPAQPGTAAPGSDSPRQPGTTVAPPAPQVEYAVPQNHRPVPVETEPAPAIEWQQLHAPEPVAPVAPIAPPPRTLRIGEFVTPAPDEVPDFLLNPVNDGASQTEAAISTGLQSVGINPSRSDKIAAATAGGAVLGAAVVGVPAAIGGAIGGGLIGAGVGAGIGAGIGVAIVAGTAVAAGVPTGGLGAAIAAPAAVPIIGGGALIGAGVGAAVGAGLGAVGVGVPAAILGGVAGGAAGGFLGGAF